MKNRTQLLCIALLIIWSDNFVFAQRNEYSTPSLRKQGKASQLIVIAFEAGKPRVAAEDSALDSIVITSDRTKMSIDVFDSQNAESRKVRHYEFKAGQEESRRH